MLCIMASMAVVFQITKAQTNVWIIDILWSKMYLVVHNISRYLMARLTHSTINRFSVSYISSSALLPLS